MHSSMFFKRITCFIGYFCASLAWAGEPSVSITAQEPWADVWAGKECAWHFAVASDEALTGRAGWQLSCGDRTLARQERAIAPGPGQPESLEVRLQMPEVKEGVVLAAVLTVSVMEAESGKAVATLRKNIWIYPANPFADRGEWLKKLDIRLFDPEKKTADCFEKAGLPFKRFANIEALSEIKAGVILVGEGVSFGDYKGLPELLFKAAARGVPVLCLAPSGGSLPLPGASENGMPVPRRMLFQRNEIIAKLDKRLDAVGWQPDGAIAATTLALRSARGLIMGEVEKGGAGWPWLEMTFDDQRGRLIICHFAMIDKWDAGPAPSFLLAKILDYLAARDHEPNSN